MSYEVPILNVTLIAGEALTTKQYYGVRLNSSGQVITASEGSGIIGVIQDAPASGAAGLVMTHGITKGVLGGTVTAGQELQMDSSGRFIVKTTGTTVAIALESGAVSEQRTIMLRCN